MNAILLWLWRKLTVFIEGALDPEWKAKADAINQRSKEIDAAHLALDEKERSFQARLAASEGRQAEWQLQIDEDQKRLAELSEERKKIADELEKTKADIATRPDVDLIDRPLPGTRSQSR